MRKYKPCDEPEVDLDNPKTYKHLPKTYDELRKLMYREIGYALCYMDYFSSRKGCFPFKKSKKKLMIKHPFSKKMVNVSNSGYEQRQRVYKLIKNFANNENRKSSKDLMWWKEQVFLFQDETENMC